MLKPILIGREIPFTVLTGFGVLCGGFNKIELLSFEFCEEGVLILPVMMELFDVSQRYFTPKERVFSFHFSVSFDSNFCIRS
jgi:hypothetical protein